MPALTEVRVGKSFYPRAAWTEGKSFLIPETAFEKYFKKYSDAGRCLTLPVDMPIDPKESQNLRLRAAFTPKRPLFASLPVSYQRVPPALRSLAASFWGQRQKERLASSFPRWPLDLSADFLSDTLGGNADPMPSGPAPVILSHDLDSSEGLKNLVGLFLKIEENAGARSVNYVVPCAWPIDHGLLKEARERGHEIGIHGYDHSNRTPFCADARRKRRLEKAQELIDRYAVTGYRAPSLFRTPALLRDLSRYYRYDSSIPTSGGLFPTPGNGCAGARPFRFGDLAELPISLPRDGSLRFLGHSPEQILKLWIDCAEEIASSRGVIVLLTHCEKRFSGDDKMLAIYRQFLDYIGSSERFSWSAPAEALKSHLR